MIRRTPHEIANEIRMTRSLFSGAFLVVEGLDDRLFMQSFISPSTCRIEVADGKDNVCRVINILDEDDFDGVLGLIDADFDRIEGDIYGSPNLVMPECHDLVTMLVCSPALGRILVELGSRPKLETFEEDVLNALFDRALPLGYLRLYSQREGLGLRFHGLDYSTWIDRPSFMASKERLVEAVKNHSQRHGLSSSVLIAAIDELNGSELDPHEICAGTDLVEILSISLRGILGNRNPGDVKAERLKSSLRLAFSEQDFRLSILRRDIKKWQSLTTGFRVLSKDET